MPIVTGVLADFGKHALSTANQNLQPVIEFHPSSNAVNLLTGALYATRTVTTTPDLDTGSWAVDLETTDNLAPEVWYDVVLTWLDPDGNFISKDHVPWRIYVPSTGGYISDVSNVPANPAHVWIGLDPPPTPTPGTWWLVDDPSNPGTGSGDLLEWS